MEALSEDLDDGSDSPENRLLKSEDSPCVCSKTWEKDSVCGWAPSLVKKISRSKPTKTYASFSNARKDGKCSLTECGFVFRHYEQASRYIEQYRENHSSAFLEKGAEWRPVLGVDVPDPYLPEIASSSQSFDRAKFIEAMSDYYKVAAMRSDLQKICLTGKRTENGDRKTASSNNTKLNKEGLPFILTSSSDKQVSQKPIHRKQSIPLEEERTDVGKNREDLIRTAPELTQDYVLPSVPSKPDIPHRAQDKPVFLNSADCQSKDKTKRFQRERIRLPKFQWTECHVKKSSKETSTTNAKVEDKETKPTVENILSSDSDESLTRHLVSRGNLYLGSNVQSPKSKSKPDRVAVGKCEVFSSTVPSTAEQIRKSHQTGTKTKIPSEKAFIQILGQQTGPPPKAAGQNGTKETSKRRPKTEEKAFINQNLPLQYLTRFGRRKFHHVLEARSFKPGERKLGTAALANFHH